jgi:class 3 adenylate cyclase/tetratricopeptide (TPR) repeat protein
MICPRCQSENSPSSGFCDQCGARLETACPNCGEPNRHGARFCRNCGQQITPVQTTAPSAVPGAPSPDTYVPKHLAEKILASRHTLEGERKQVTVLFADIRGSTKLVEGLDPEEAQKLIDPVLRVMMDAVHRYEGTVNQILGDGIMALFGAPLAHEDHAVRACYAALAMQEEMRRYRENLGQTDEIGVQIGVGLNSGEVVVRSIDNDLNIDYSALGHTTHLASRMQELADAGIILMTASTLREVEGFIQVKALGGIQVKGVSRPVDAYELIGATSARTRLHASVARGLTPFVGRKAEIETFQKLIEKSAGGRGQIFAMVGEPGMGKSRLVYEFTHSHVPQDWLVLEAPSVSYGKAAPYFPVIELLRHYFEISEGEGAESIREKIADRVLKLDEMLKDAIPPILSLLGALPDHKEIASLKSNGQWQDAVETIKRFNGMEPQQRRRYILEGLKRVMIRESQKQPLLLVFEDLHWIDNETQAFLDNLVESLPMARMLLLVNYRPGYSHSWADKTYYTQIRVDPLQSASAEELLHHLLGNDKELAPLKELLIKRTDGNPFFAEESVRSLVETGILIGEKGAYSPGLKVDSISIPSRVQNVVADRIDRLHIEKKHLLQTAAVIGVMVPFRLLRAVTELPEDELYEHLSALQAAEFLYETNLFPEVEYSFKHALTNEVAYGALLHERRTLLHAGIVKSLEEITENTSHDHLEKLAHHAFRGELWDKAVIYLKETGAKAVSLSSFRNAVLYFEKALEALRHLPRTNDNLRNAVDLRIDIRNAFFILGEFQQGIQHLDEAKAAAVSLNDEGRLGMVFNLITAHWNLAGNSEQAITSGKQALEHTKASEHLDLHIVAHYFLGAAYHSVGQYDRAVDVFGRAVALIGSRKYELFGTTGVVFVVCRAWLARCFAQLGKFSEGISYGDRAIETALESKHPYSIVYAYYGLGVLLFIRGDFEKAVEVLSRGLEVCESADIPVQRPLVTSCLGAAHAFLGRCNEALQLLDKAVEDAAWSQRMGGQALRMAWVSAGYMLAGRLEAAEAFAKRGLELSRESKDQGSQAWLLCILGNLASRRSPLNAELVGTHYVTALSLARELGMRPLQAHCRLALGDVSAQVNDFSKAHSELRAAVELYRAMSMTFWLSRAEANLARIGSTS